MCQRKSHLFTELLAFCLLKLLILWSLCILVCLVLFYGVAIVFKMNKSAKTDFLFIWVPFSTPIISYLHVNLWAYHGFRTGDYTILTTCYHKFCLLQSVNSAKLTINPLMVGIRSIVYGSYLIGQINLIFRQISYT